jgi:hypothetical protein
MDAPLAGRSVAMGVSDPDPGDLVERRLSGLHVRHAFVELARHLLAAGATVNYGGDLRRGGFTELLFDLVRAYDMPSRPDAVVNYLAWPTGSQLTKAQEADLHGVARIVKMPAPDGAPSDPSDPIDPELVATALSAMRARMVAGTDARVILGGKLKGYSGAFPGLAEEAALTLRARKPLYVAGGFGGCSVAVAAALQGREPHEEFVRRGDLLVDTFRTAGVVGLGNGLTVEENERLFVVADVEEIVTLVLRGLRRVTNDQDSDNS